MTLGCVGGEFVVALWNGREAADRHVALLKKGDGDSQAEWAVRDNRDAVVSPCSDLFAQDQMRLYGEQMNEVQVDVDGTFRGVSLDRRGLDAECVPNEDEVVRLRTDPPVFVLRRKQ